MVKTTCSSNAQADSLFSTKFSLDVLGSESVCLSKWHAGVQPWFSTWCSVQLSALSFGWLGWLVLMVLSGLKTQVLETGLAASVSSKPWQTTVLYLITAGTATNSACPTLFVMSLQKVCSIKCTGLTFGRANHAASEKHSHQTSIPIKSLLVSSQPKRVILYMIKLRSKYRQLGSWQQTYFKINLAYTGLG